jgi:hypothetical protein
MYYVPTILDEAAYSLTSDTMADAVEIVGV